MIKLSLEGDESESIADRVRKTLHKTIGEGDERTSALCMMQGHQYRTGERHNDKQICIVCHHVRAI